MADSIKIGNLSVDRFYLGNDSGVKIYLGSTKLYPHSSSYDVCYAVVDSISTYTARTYADVYETSTDKWYKLNNLNQYEEYGIYGSGRTITTYEGKLTIDGDYEYEYSGGSWVNVGEVSGGSITIKSPEYIEKDSTHNGKINLDYVWKTNSKMQFKFYSTNNGGGSMIGESGTSDNNDCRMFFATTIAYFDWGSSRISWTSNGRTNTLYEYEYGNYYIKNMVTSASKTSSTISTSRTNPLYLGIGGSDMFRTYYLKFYEGDTLVKDFIPWTDMNGNYGLFDKVSLSVYNVVSGSLTGSSNVTDVEVSGQTEYPIYYDDKSDPLDNLTFNTLEAAEAYAYNNCVYDGMHATIAGSKYIFNSEDGWVIVPMYYKFEDVTPNSASGWTISGSSTYNPDLSYYDDFDLETNWTSQSYKIAKVTIYGYDHFTYYLRSYNQVIDSYAYVMATNVDELSTAPTNLQYNSASAISTTYYFSKSAGSAVNLNNYRRITYNNLDKTVEHTFYVVFYGASFSSYKGNATILIPKEQTNENWEQVTFSASSNVAIHQKSLYIDNSYSSNGGTQDWYYRWMVGLPSGSHTSNTNYSNYNYCPNVTSSTFTSVAGNSRQVNYTYDGTTNKNLSFRLTDGSGNVLTPSDTIYYDMTYYNSCSISSGVTSTTFPRTQSVKVDGRFRFANSSNRHYIYGYSPSISLNYDYYVNNYQSTFDITYTKLSDETVTITYTTYDPNDSETPTFNTDITYPYNGGTTSSTTLTSYTVPYTYSYKVNESSGMFSAATQTYTAGQASRTISFVLYPNNREFASVSDLEAYQYAWEGMEATVNGTNYKYENGEWVKNQHSLPDVPFVLNYNARQYNASTHSIPMTTGQLNDTDAVAYNNPNNIIDHSADGYITISNSSMRIRKQSQDISLFNRSSNSTSSDLTIICKAKSTSSENIITNRDGNYNWMYRLKTSGILTFHGTSETSSISWNTSNPDIMSIRTYYDSGTKLKYNNWTQNTSTSPTSFTYGSTNTDGSAAGALFVGYSWSSTEEQWSGDFYWVYMAQANLTDEQVQQVIDYNENL